MSRRAWRFVLPLAAIWLVVLLLVVCLSQTAHAQEVPYTSDDVLAAISQASAEVGVSAAWIERVVRCEDPTLDPYAVGRLGELGAAQLHPRGLLPVFFSWGYLDPYSPYQAIRFMAQEFSFGRAGAWSCR